MRLSLPAALLLGSFHDAPGLFAEAQWHLWMELYSRFIVRLSREPGALLMNLITAFLEFHCNLNSAERNTF